MHKTVAQQLLELQQKYESLQKDRNYLAQQLFELQKQYDSLFYESRSIALESTLKDVCYQLYLLHEENNQLADELYQCKTTLRNHANATQSLPKELEKNIA